MIVRQQIRALGGVGLVSDRAAAFVKKAKMIPIQAIRNPILRTSDNLRDPSVFRKDDGYCLLYSRYSNGRWNRPENWAVACCFTDDFLTFRGDRDISPKNYASPGDVVFWRGRYLLPFQSYPLMPQRLYYAESSDGSLWSPPRPFLEEVLGLPWNKDRRAIDPCFVVDRATLHCFFVGSQGARSAGPRANLLGHAFTQDPGLRQWEVVSRSGPIMGRERAPDGVENIVAYQAGGAWTMLFSEGLEDQHLALAQSDDLLEWRYKGRVDVPVQRWFAHRHGAPFVWKEGKIYYMVLMGEEDANHRSSLGLLVSEDGFEWRVLPER